jgi:hypothetical protein
VLIASGDVAEDKRRLSTVGGVIRAVDRELSYSDGPRLRLSQDAYFGVKANSTLLASAQSPIRRSILVARCGEKLSSTIAIRTWAETWTVGSGEG